MNRFKRWLLRRPRHVHVIYWTVLRDMYATDAYLVSCVCTNQRDCPREGVPFWSAVVSDVSWSTRLQMAYDSGAISAGAYYGAPIAGPGPGEGTLADYVR